MAGDRWSYLSGVGPGRHVIDCEPDSGCSLSVPDQGLESKIVPAAGFRWRQFRRATQRLSGLLPAAKDFISGSLRVRKIIREFKPGVVLGTGNVSPVVWQRRWPGAGGDSERMLSRDWQHYLASWPARSAYRLNRRGIFGHRRGRWKPEPLSSLLQRGGPAALQPGSDRPWWRSSVEAGGAVNRVMTRYREEGWWPWGI